MEPQVITVRYADDLSPTARHFHDCYQLIYVVDGQASITVNGRTYTATSGSIAVIGRFEQHSIAVNGLCYKRYAVSVDPAVCGNHSLLGNRLLSVLLNRPSHFCHIAQLRDPQLAEMILSQMEQECRSKDTMGDRMLLLLLSQLLILYCRQNPDSIPETSTNLKLVQEIRQYLEDNYAQRCELDSLAQRFHLSQSHLSHLFRRVTGSSVIAYLTAYRLTAAKHCLIETDWEIRKVAESCGFTDHSNFGRTFKTNTGLSPTQFRQQYKR